MKPSWKVLQTRANKLIWTFLRVENITLAYFLSSRGIIKPRDSWGNVINYEVIDYVKSYNFYVDHVNIWGHLKNKINSKSKNLKQLRVPLNDIRWKIVNLKIEYLIRNYDFHINYVNFEVISK